MKRPRVMSVDGRRMVDPTAMEAYCIGAESTINELESRLAEAVDATLVAADVGDSTVKFRVDHRMFTEILWFLIRNYSI